MVEFYSSIQNPKLVEFVHACQFIVYTCNPAKCIRKKMELETPIMVEILRNTLCNFPHMEMLRIGHIDVEFIPNCVDFWIEFELNLN